MLPPVPRLEDYGISEQYGFLPSELPLQILPDPYYNQWEAIAGNLQALLLCRRLREVVRKLPILSTSHLMHPAEWRRAYMLLAFITHGYIWGGDTPAEVSSPTHHLASPLLTRAQRIPPSISIPFLKICSILELPPVATYAGVCLWNFKPIFVDEPINTLDNLATLTTFTGSLDESWFYLISVAIEARGAPLIPLLVNAISAAREGDSETVTAALQLLAERLDELGTLMNRMYEHCDPHVFYHRIRPFLAGSKNMADAGLPNGVIYQDGSGAEKYRQYGGGSNAQSSLIQFFDIILGVTHRPTGTGPPPPPPPSHPHNPHSSSSPSSVPQSADQQGPSHNFIHEMRAYMPGPHARFLHDVTATSNIRPFVLSRPADRALSLAYDAALAMLRSLRDKHIAMVSRYIIVKSRENRAGERGLSPTHAPVRRNIATATTLGAGERGDGNGGMVDGRRGGRSKMRGTGGTALIPFLKQARDETGEPAIDAWARRLLGDKAAPGINGGWGAGGGADGWGRVGQGKKGVELGKVGEHHDGVVEIVGLAGTWGVDENEGGLCHW
ncbi:MAG: hypothetical protein LQ340_001293 [Diploschistes diacapsis]|nr:MAG: hypothetical protein LQ340_001293 [Diploschistes diacapsis]